MGATPSSPRRVPFPDYVFDAVGEAFVVGATGGSAWHFLKGLRNSPSGHRLSGGAQAALMNAPRSASSWAAWFGVSAAIESAMASARQKEDPWNWIIAAAGTGGLLSVRQGARAVAYSALACATASALLEVGFLKLRCLNAKPQRNLPSPPAAGPSLPGLPPASPTVDKEVSADDCYC